MTGTLLESGKVLLARILAGEILPINGMYITCSSKRDEFISAPSVRFFEDFHKVPTNGVARVAILGCTPKDTSVVFNALITSADFVGTNLQTSFINTATLVHMTDQDMTKDIFVYTAPLKEPIKMVKGAYITINVGLSIGA